MTTLTRRRALGVAASAAAGLAAGRALTTSDRAVAAPAHRSTGPDTFDEVYQGRRIQGAPSHTGGHHGHGAHGDGYAVRIDGEELHLMRNADGTWISVINHYEPLATPRAVARAAVRELQGATLVPLAPPLA
ncbi:apotyrosinase chaperone MelC1 [Streptomyces ficellus]|uniref:Tyrosinase n=1 Tax=Streptomyces ficellus TaxID=1977088 RepID=A0A6I6F0E3_9ACTN|nr:tyrosinase cofactor [Streptomyces ficellus]QGV77393.1 tyrosinase [Streptomyces ficellus]